MGTQKIERLRQQVASLVIECILSDIQDSKVQDAKKFGVSIETQRILENLKAIDMESLKNLYKTYISDSLQFNSEGFEKAASMTVDKQKNRAIENQALRLGACASLMRHLFGIHSVECANRKKILNINTPPGRTKIPEYKDQLCIHEVWNESKDLSEAVRFINVAEKTGLQLNQIWSLYNKDRTEICFIEPERVSTGTYER